MLALVMSAASPDLIGIVVWKEHPTLRALMKMITSERYRFPTVDSDESMREEMKKCEQDAREEVSPFLSHYQIAIACYSRSNLIYIYRRKRTSPSFSFSRQDLTKGRARNLDRESPADCKSSIKRRKLRKNWPVSTYRKPCIALIFVTQRLIFVS
jgi:hypothetical protein